MQRGICILIERHQPEWDQIAPPPTWLTEAQEVYATASGHGVDRQLIDCVMLGRLLTLFRKLVPFADPWASVGITSKSKKKRWNEKVVALRDTLAHGGSVLDATPDTDAPADFILHLRTFTRAVWDEVLAEE